MRKEKVKGILVEKRRYKVICPFCKITSFVCFRGDSNDNDYVHLSDYTNKGECKHFVGTEKRMFFLFSCDE